MLGEVLDLRADEVLPGDWIEDGLRVAAVTHHRLAVEVVLPEGLGLSPAVVEWVELSLEQTSAPATFPPSTPVKVVRA